MDRGVRPEDDIVTGGLCYGEVTLRSNRRTEGFTTALKEIGYQGIRKGDLVCVMYCGCDWCLRL